MTASYGRMLGNGRSKMDWDKVKEELQKPLRPDAIKAPPKGKFGEYVDALHVIREANRIFGEDGWSYSVTRLEMTNRTEVGEQLRIGYLCSVRVDIDGICREGVSAGSGIGKATNEADLHDSAIKEAETDALKRALRTFGNTFGLALYEKDKAAREVGYSTPQEVIDQIRNLPDLEGLKVAWNTFAQYRDDPAFCEAIKTMKIKLTKTKESEAA